MVVEWAYIPYIMALEDKTAKLEQDLRTTQGNLAQALQELDEVRFELEWERLLASDDLVNEAFDSVRPLGDDAIRSVIHAYRTPRNAKDLRRIARKIALKVEKNRFIPFDPDSVRRDLESRTPEPTHKGVVNDVDLGWEWQGDHFWTEGAALRARQAHINEGVAERTARVPL